MNSIILYDDTGEKLSPTKARKLFRQGELVEDPTGHGYRRVLEHLGYSRTTLEDSSSSAGDWVVKVKGGFVFQSNRYPLCGFSYRFAKKDAVYIQ